MGDGSGVGAGAWAHAGAAKSTAASVRERWKPLGSANLGRVMIDFTPSLMRDIGAARRGCGAPPGSCDSSVTYPFAGAGAVAGAGIGVGAGNAPDEPVDVATSNSG